MVNRRTVTVLMLLAVAAISQAQEGKVYPPPDETECWECHAPGLWDPPMNPNFQMVPGVANVTIGQPFDYKAELFNTWLAEQQDMFVTLDLRDAPSLQFVGGEDPILDVSQTGTINIDPSRLDQPQREQVQIEVPSGATSLRITLAPTDRDPNTGPDLTLRIFDAFANPSGSATFTVNDAGKGQAEVFRLDGASNIAGHGFGNWTVEAQMRPVQTSGAPSLDPQPTGAGFRVTTDAWFNATGETVQVVNKKGPVGSGGRELFSWGLVATAPPGPDEELHIIANVTTHYDHDGPDDPDYGDMSIVASTPIRAAGDKVQVGLETQVVVVKVQPKGVSLAAISEAVGYAAAFLLVASVWTGGMFGKASRRHLNVIFGSARRRVAFHNFLSYGIIVTAIVHLILFIIEIDYHWALGLIWGGLGTLAMLGLGVTGAIQVPMIRRWNYATWRWVHLGLSIATIVFTLVHMALDGQNFQALVSDRLGYEDPLVEWLDPGRS